MKAVDETRLGELRLPATLVDVLKAIREAGGRGLLVGGMVRDELLGHSAKDFDVEVHQMTVGALEKVLSKFGAIQTIGRAFGVLQVKAMPAVDFSLPRRDSKVGDGHRGFEVKIDPGLDFAEAARRRDLTVNSIGFDPLTQEIIDPHHGITDLKNGVLRATDPGHFSEDPLRGLRVAQFAARFGLEPVPELKALCATLDLSQLSAERLWGELEKLLMQGMAPSIGFKFLRETDLLRFFPELQALVGVPQDAQWHPEGDVWVHTLMVVDEAAKLRRNDDEDAALMWGALCHDLGKPTTTFEEAGRIRSPAHDVAGIEPTRDLMLRLKAPHHLIEQVVALVVHHLAPALFIKNKATDKGYRRLARKLSAADVSAELLWRVATADHFGRTTKDALAREFAAGDEFMERMASLTLTHEGPKDVVMGRHLIARGFKPGRQFKEILQACRDYQDEHGATDPEYILDKVDLDSGGDR